MKEHNKNNQMIEKNLKEQKGKTQKIKIYVKCHKKLVIEKKMLIYI